AGTSDLGAGTAVAGPVNVHDDPWVFTPSAPGLTMEAGSSYEFFVARMHAPPAPTPTPFPTPPPATFQLVAPLQWPNGSFSNVGGADCSNVPPSSAPAFLATANGPFAVSGSMTLAPNCVPASAETLYLIATQVAPAGGACGESNKYRRARAMAPKDSQIVDG